eukprot:2017686-Amphidinium_carterae.1
MDAVHIAPVGPDQYFLDHTHWGKASRSQVTVGERHNAADVGFHIAGSRAADKLLHPCSGSNSERHGCGCGLSKILETSFQA